jgi:hypothetical protein
MGHTSVGNARADTTNRVPERIATPAAALRVVIARAAHRAVATAIAALLTATLATTLAATATAAAATTATTPAALAFCARSTLA